MHLPKERRNQLQLRLPDYVSDTTRERVGKGKLGREREYRMGKRKELGREYFEEKRYLVRERKNAADDLQFR